ncbi:unnamed protein product [Adineta ricciae]|uniref:Uncharacterized protein n=1 Tax=Adineta ricciae TaxID=249248 RepID=A0A815DY32_ADIRI|nr:unnamed protein product [Adineta ricciae]CAF1307572.1 unnamed protein product [Adineta ricciae]
MFNNKIGFDFLNDEQIAELLPLVDLAHKIKLDVTNTDESKQYFINMIFGQTVYALKSCSTKINHNVHNGSQCLVVSTIFREISNDSSSIYQVYHLTPSPTPLTTTKSSSRTQQEKLYWYTHSYQSKADH